MSERITKPCSVCGYTDRNAHGNCKPCNRRRQSAAKQKDPEAYKARAHAVYLRRKERQAERRRELVAMDPGRYSAAARAWRTANPDKAREATARWRAANPEKASESKRRANHARRARSVGVLSPGIVARLYELQRGKCACCRLPLGNNYHLDHVVPLALGGSNTDDNVQLLRPQCNQKKSKRHPVEYMQSKGFLL